MTRARAAKKPKIHVQFPSPQAAIASQESESSEEEQESDSPPIKKKSANRNKVPMDRRVAFDDEEKIITGEFGATKMRLD
jgi:hypothetical protein